MKHLPLTQRRQARKEDAQRRFLRWIAVALLALLFLATIRGLVMAVEMVSPQSDFLFPGAPVKSTPNDTFGETVTVVEMPTTDPYLPTPTLTPQTTSTPALSSVDGESELTPTREEVVEYIRHKFGKDWKVALAVAKSEGWPHREGQGWNRSLCSDLETSWGIFQINLARGCNAEGKKVHWNRIPGDTLQEKIDWLSNPYHNVDYAYTLFTEQGGFQAWSGYKNKSYLKFL